jgi:hypothetical protein
MMMQPSLFNGCGPSQIETMNPIPPAVEVYGPSSDEAEDSDPNQFAMDSKLFLGEFGDTTLGLAYDNENLCSDVKLSAHVFPFESAQKDLGSDFQ